MTVSQVFLFGAPFSFLIAASAMVQEQEPFYTWFYTFAWWSYILFIESFFFSRGYASLLFDNFARFLLLLPLSVTIWLIFEVLNFRMHNWHYLQLPSSRGMRWAGYTLAYATVLPALFTTKNLLDFLGFFRETKKFSEGFGRFRDRLVMIGVVMLTLPLLFPKIFFPLVWMGFVFLLEPLNYRNGAGSLLRDFEEGSGRNLYLLLMSGLICGVLWECWNFGAGSKWVYTLPYFDFLRLFEMPVFGFLGFPPFAVECYVMANTCFFMIDRIHQRCDSGVQALFLIGIGTVVLVFGALCYLGIDALTVKSFNDTAW
jgi:hypothetical protein